LDGIGKFSVGYQFVQDVQRDASGRGLSSPRNPAVIARVVHSNASYAAAHLPDGTPAPRATWAQWPFSGWRAQIEFSASDAVCLTIPENNTVQPALALEACP
jgi:hypothetical protein